MSGANDRAVVGWGMPAEIEVDKPAPSAHHITILLAQWVLASELGDTNRRCEAATAIAHSLDGVTLRPGAPPDEKAAFEALQRLIVRCREVVL